MNKDCEMHEKMIRKTENQGPVCPNLSTYDTFYSAFSWENALRELDGLPNNNGINIAYESVDRHVFHGDGEKIALRFISKANEITDFTFQKLRDLSNQFANVLKKLGVEKGDRVFVLMDRIPELYITALGTWKNNNVFCPLFSAFGPEPIQTRLVIGSGKVLVTTKKLFLKKIQSIKNNLPELKKILIVDDD